MNPTTRRVPTNPSYYDNMVFPLARHEAGHYVAARALGFKTGSIKLTIIDLEGGYHLGGSEVELDRALYKIDDIMKYLEDRVQVLYAGALAQSLSNGKVVCEDAVEILKKRGGWADLANAREHIPLIRNIRYPSAT